LVKYFQYTTEKYIEKKREKDIIKRELKVKENREKNEEKIYVLKRKP
jgi:hypothetical protein